MKIWKIYPFVQQSRNIVSVLLPLKKEQDKIKSKEKQRKNELAPISSWYTNPS